MGVKIKDILVYDAIEPSSLTDSIIAFDAFNQLYQFLSTIKQPDGGYLMDSKGRITSHLSGLFYRMSRLMMYNIRPVFVFDGKAPKFKEHEIALRRERKDEIIKKYEQALKEGRTDMARRYAMQITFLTSEMIEESKKLLELMGIPWIVAPSEAEAQASKMAEQGIVSAVASQDFDSLLFGAPRLIRNLSLTERRKLPGKNIYMKTEVEDYSLDKNLSMLGITRRKLVVIGMLVGTDFNPGIKGIGPKKALKLVRSKDEEQIMEEYGLPHEILEFFLYPPYREVEIPDARPDYDRLLEFLLDREFSRERVEKVINQLRKGRNASLSRWFS